MNFRILGPLEVGDGGRTVALGGDKQRALLAILLLHRNEVVSADQLIDDLWGERPPATAVKTLQAYVSRLRKALDDHGERASGSSNGALVTRGRGYLLRVAAGELDVERFGGLVEEGRRALATGAPEAAARILREGLALWRGPPLADFAYEAFAQAPIAQLEELRLGAIEERVEADLALGRHEQMVGELAALVEQNPLRERLRAHLMLALYRCGRQAEALEVYQEFRQGLSRELGLEPSNALQLLERAILMHDTALELGARAVRGQGRRCRVVPVQGSCVLRRRRRGLLLWTGADRRRPRFPARERIVRRYRRLLGRRQVVDPPRRPHISARARVFCLEAPVGVRWS